MTTSGDRPQEGMQDQPEAGGPDNSRAGMHVCANCFAEFDWSPTVEDGEEFCCAGCARGGPCICTYGAPPLRTAAGAPEEPEPTPPAVPARSAAQPVERRRAELVLAAVSELPVEIRAVVTLRITRDIDLSELAAELNLPLEVVERRLNQGRALLQRTLGSEFEIEYMPLVGPGVVPVGPPPAEPVLVGGPAERPSLVDFVSDSLRGIQPLAVPERGFTDEDRDAQETLREALGEAAEIFRLASQRLGLPPAEREPLRRLLQDEPPGYVTLTASEVSDTAGYLQALEALPEVQSVRVESVEGREAAYVINATSGSRLVSGLLRMPPAFRPRNLRLGMDTVEVALGAVAAPAEPSAPVFELGAEAFFTARHYVAMGGVEGPLHQHSFRVEILTESSSQDEDGVVIGFANARRMVEELVDTYNESLLNTVPPFDEVQPTLENIAKVIYQDLAPKLAHETVKLKQVRVWESPTNHASYSE